MRNDLYQAIIKYKVVFGHINHDDPANIAAYMRLVDLCIKYNIIPACNRTIYSTHSLLTAAITYDSHLTNICKDNFHG